MATDSTDCSRDTTSHVTHSSGGPSGRSTASKTIPSITCKHCGMTSYNPNDIANRYCGYCHQFHDDAGRIAKP